jgi:hypothetical protein
MLFPSFGKCGIGSLNLNPLTRNSCSSRGWGQKLVHWNWRRRLHLDHRHHFVLPSVRHSLILLLYPSFPTEEIGSAPDLPAPIRRPDQRQGLQSFPFSRVPLVVLSPSSLQLAPRISSLQRASTIKAWTSSSELLEAGSGEKALSVPLLINSSLSHISKVPSASSFYLNTCLPSFHFKIHSLELNRPLSLPRHLALRSV